MVARRDVTAKETTPARGSLRILVGCRARILIPLRPESRNCGGRHCAGHRKGHIGVGLVIAMVGMAGLLVEARKLSKEYLVFHRGAGGLTAVRMATGIYFQLSQSSYAETADFPSLGTWYMETIRSECADHDGL